MNGALLFEQVLLRAERDRTGEDRYSIDDLRQCAKDEVSFLLAHDVLVQTEPGYIVECDACYEQHYEEVTWVPGPPGSLPRAYIACPQHGQVRVKPERLDRWRFSLNGLARLLANQLGSDSAEEIVAGRVWGVAAVTIRDAPRTLCLGLGLAWPDQKQIIASTTSATRYPPAWLVMGMSASPDGVPLADSALLSDVLRFDGSAMRLSDSLFPPPPDLALTLPAPRASGSPHESDDDPVTEDEIRGALEKIDATPRRLEILLVYRGTRSFREAKKRINIGEGTFNKRVSEIRTDLAALFGQDYAERIVPYRREGLRKQG